MQGDRQVIQQLNKNLGLLLVTINQYFLHARILKNWGLEELGCNFYKRSIKEMKSADSILARVCRPRRRRSCFALRAVSR